ncbi:uncharacterized protein V1516DRAFT_680979 [Lipomyces oligophaga]|uniref:uncharacterized protein n=1 Tax=Lipomyces oligophaga TaxID=45792 RepID=UPI0034CD1115
MSGIYSAEDMMTSDSLEYDSSTLSSPPSVLEDPALELSTSSPTVDIQSAEKVGGNLESPTRKLRSTESQAAHISELIESPRSRTRSGQTLTKIKSNPCIICGNRYNHRKYKDCTQCGEARVHVICLATEEQMSYLEARKMKWLCSTCKQKFNSTRSLRLLPEAVPVVTAIQSSPPERTSTRSMQSNRRQLRKKDNEPSEIPLKSHDSFSNGIARLRQLRQNRGISSRSQSQTLASELVQSFSSQQSQKRRRDEKMVEDEASSDGNSKDIKVSRDNRDSKLERRSRVSIRFRPLPVAASKSNTTARVKEHNLVTFNKTAHSYLVKINLIKLASHVDIHFNNLGISGYLTYDQEERNAYFPSAKNKSGNEEVPYGGILTAKQSATSKTVPTSFDRMAFGKTMLLALEQEKSRLGRSRRVRRRSVDSSPLKKSNNLHNGNLNDSPSSSLIPSEMQMANTSDSSSDESFIDISEQEEEVESSPEPSTQAVSKIRAIRFRNYEIDTWYISPYPEEYSRRPLLYICEFCLKYMPSEYVNWRHQLKCLYRHPPGDEIYRSGNLSVFEVDGRKNTLYCQNLCLLAKLFLGSKTLYYDVEPFLFYILTETDNRGCHFIGYFSKEKRNTTNYNLSCILTLPIYRRKGYGHFLIAFSYMLSRVEGKFGTPEKPLSDLGLLSYRNYWKLALSYEFRNMRTTENETISINELAKRTGMTPDDVVSGLESLKALVRRPEDNGSERSEYQIRVDSNLITSIISNWEALGHAALEPDKLIWTPLVVGRSSGINSLSYTAASWQVAFAELDNGLGNLSQLECNENV